MEIDIDPSNTNEKIIDHYIVYVYVRPVNESYKAYEFNVPSSARKYNIESLECGHTYEITLHAVNKLVHLLNIINYIDYYGYICFVY